MDRTLYRVRRADGGEVEVDSLAAAKKQYPDGTILYRVGFDAVGNPQQQPFTGKQPSEGNEDPAPVEETPAAEAPVIDQPPTEPLKGEAVTADEPKSGKRAKS